jgi:hypothetical protein
MQMGYYFGAIGGAIAGAKLAMLRFLYVIDKNTNEIFTVTPESLETMLADDKDLSFQFRNETEKESEEILMKYVKLLNEK